MDTVGCWDEKHEHFSPFCFQRYPLDYHRLSLIKCSKIKGCAAISITAGHLSSPQL